MKPIRFTLQAVASILLMLAISACPPTPVNPPPDADASIVLVDASCDGMCPSPVNAPSCASWCTQAAILGCAAALPSSSGATCLDVCANVQSGPVPFDLVCRTKAASCAIADACENTLLVVVTKGIDAGLYDDAGRGDGGDGGIFDLMKKKAVTCADWCAHAASLKCPGAQLTPKGAPCVEVCNNVMSGPKPFNLKCRAGAASCAAADRCEP